MLSKTRYSFIKHLLSATFVLVFAINIGSAQNADSLYDLAMKYKRCDSTRLEHYFMATWLYQSIDLDKALQMAEDGLSESKECNNKRSIYMFMVTKATIFQTQGQWAKSIAGFKEAIRLVDSMKKYKWLDPCYNNLGNTYSLMGDVKNAIISLEKGIECRRKYNKEQSWGADYGNIGALYARLDQYSTAVEKMMIVFTDTSITTFTRINAYCNMTDLYCALEKKDSADRYFGLLKELIKSKEAMPANFIAYYGAEFEYRKAFDKTNKDYSDYHKAFALAKEIGVETNLANFYQLYGRKLYEHSNKDSAIFYLEESVKIYNKIKAYVELQEIYQTLGEWYYENGDKDKAYSNLMLAGKTRDSVFSQQSAEALTQAEVKYDTQQKEEKNRLLEKEKQADALLKKLYLLLGLLASVGVALYFLYRKNKSEKELKNLFAQQLLNAQEQERQRIAKDLHDSVGQNILFIKNQLQSKERDDNLLVKSIDTALEEVRSISKNLYPNQLEKYGLKSAVEALGEQVQASSGIFISSDLEGIDEALNKNVQINFYRIIQEFVNNSIKHSGASAIRITAEQSPSEIKLTVQDNGKGFDKQEVEKKASTSFGLLNMEERIKMLKGKVSIESEIGKGTKSTFTIPV
jgi:signal transduction histidine kinase